MRRGRPFDLERIFEEIDYRQRFVPDFDVLAAALRRAGVDGVLLELSPGTYVTGWNGSDSGTVPDLQRETYESGLRAYHRAFMETLVKLNSGRAMRGTVGLFAAVHGLTRGRVGIKPGIVDLDGVSLTFILNDALEPLGWACDSAVREGEVRTIEVVELERGDRAPRDRVIAQIQDTLSDRSPFHGRRLRGRPRVLFADGAIVELQTT